MTERWVQPPLPGFEELVSLQQTYADEVTLAALRDDIRAVGDRVTILSEQVGGLITMLLGDLPPE